MEELENIKQNNNNAAADSNLSEEVLRERELMQ